MKKINFLSYIIVIFLIVFPLILSCQSGLSGKPQPVVKDGFLDLREWDFKTDGPVDLRGEWKFKWMEDNEEFSLPDYDDADWDTIKVPGYWNDKSRTGKGFGWLRLKIITKDTKDLGLYLIRSDSAYKMFVNGTILMQNGITGTSRKTNIPQLLPVTAVLPADNVIIIAWNIANYHYINGGPGKTPRVGMIKQIRSSLWKNDLRESIIIGIIFMMFLYHLVLWFGRMEDKASIYFSLLCFIIITRIIITNSYIERLYPIVSLTIFEIHDKIAISSEL